MQASTVGNARHDMGGASPEYGIKAWVSDQLRPKHARTGCLCGGCSKPTAVQCRA